MSGWKSSLAGERGDDAAMLLCIVWDRATRYRCLALSPGLLCLIVSCRMLKSDLMLISTFAHAAAGGLGRFPSWRYCASCMLRCFSNQRGIPLNPTPLKTFNLT